MLLDNRVRGWRPDELRSALERRWEEHRAHARTPAQVLGQHSSWLGGSPWRVPRSNLASTPCYHLRETNRVRTDGTHTSVEVDRQMTLLRERRGPGQHAQLIGGEVTLLSPRPPRGGDRSHASPRAQADEHNQL